MNWRWQGINLTGTRISTSPDFIVYDQIEVTGFDEEENEFTLGLCYREAEGRYVIQRMSIEIVEGDDEITGAWLRELPMLALSRGALAEGKVVELSSGGLFDPAVVAAASESIVAGGPSSQEAMLATARTYRYAQILQQPPAKAVQEVLGLTAPTATLWIRRARTLGMLGESTQTDG